jgi:hypothetical protein
MKNIAKAFIFLTAFVFCLTTCETPTDKESTNAGTLFVYAGTASSLGIANDSRGYTFPDTFLNESNEVTITLKNTGDGIIQLTGKPYIILDGATVLFSVSVPPESSTISPGGASVSFKIKFTPLNATESYVYVSIPNNSKNEPDFSFMVYGKGIPPKPIAAILYNGNEIPQNGPINIGEVILTRPQNITVIIKNNGRLVLTIDTANITITGTEKEAFIIKDPPAQNISPGNQSQLIIECNPDKLGGNNATLRIPTNDSSRPQVEVYLQAQAVKGSAILQLTQGTDTDPITNNSLTPFDFGTVDLGADKPLVFTIKNTGNITLELTGDPAVESSNTVFSVSTQPAKKTLLPGIPEDTTSFIVKFTPTAEVEETAKITITNNSDEMIFTLNVKGTGYVKRPQITMKQGDTTINQYEEFDFGRVPLNEPKDVSFTIGNSGDAHLSFVTVNDNRINLGENDSGFFSVIQQPSASTTVAQNATTTFSIRFNPTTVGIGYTANVLIKTNSRTNGEFSFIVKANSYEKKPQINIQQGTSVIALHGDYDFGTIASGKTKDIVFTIRNSGDANLNFITENDNRINIVDNGSGFFSVTQQPSASTVVTPGNTTAFTVRFSPAMVGVNFTATVLIKTDSRENDDFAFRVKGTARAANTESRLSGLQFSTGTLNPQFNSGIYAYELRIQEGPTLINVRPTSTDTNVTDIKVNGISQASGVLSQDIILASASTVTIAVTAEDGTTASTYTVTLKIVKTWEKLYGASGRRYGIYRAISNGEGGIYAGGFTSDDTAALFNIDKDGNLKNTFTFSSREGNIGPMGIGSAYNDFYSVYLGYYSDEYYITKAPSPSVYPDTILTTSTAPHKYPLQKTFVKPIIKERRG